VFTYFHYDVSVSVISNSPGASFYQFIAPHPPDLAQIAAGVAKKLGHLGFNR
tara:strand:+ start:452 stop:607 length:156 start_codon:yes stop_codon:yes gene_type:complete